MGSLSSHGHIFSHLRELNKKDATALAVVLQDILISLHGPRTDHFLTDTKTFMEQTTSPEDTVPCKNSKIINRLEKILTKYPEHAYILVDALEPDITNPGVSVHQEHDIVSWFTPQDKKFVDGKLVSFRLENPFLYDAAKKEAGRSLPGSIVSENAPGGDMYGLSFFYGDGSPLQRSESEASQDNVYIGIQVEPGTLAECYPAHVIYNEDGSVTIHVHHVYSNLTVPKPRPGVIFDKEAIVLREVLLCMSLLDMKKKLVFKHVKRGTIYTVTGYSTLQLDGPNDMGVVLHYSDTQGNKWTRLASEFLDGRFQEVKEGEEIKS